MSPLFTVATVKVVVSLSFDEQALSAAADSMIHADRMPSTTPRLGLANFSGPDRSNGAAN